MPQPNIVPIHTAVPGRARFQVTGLYCAAPSVKTRLERKLANAPGIYEAKANTLTGNLLLRFTAAWSCQDVASLIEQVLASDSLANGRPPTSHNDDGNGAPNAFSHPASSVGAMRAIDSAVGIVESSPPSVSTAEPPWHAQDHVAVLDALNTAPAVGLAHGVASERLARYGPNALPEPTQRSSLSLFFDQFKNLPVALLGGAAVVSLATGGVVDAAAIMVVVMINAGFGFATERQAEKTIRSLSTFTPQSTLVQRDGRAREVPVEDVVVGDILLLTPGTYVAADARLIAANDLTVDESVLTGESLPVSKNVAVLPNTNTPLAERRTMAYMGTSISGGSGAGVVVATGPRTELGTIQTLVGDAVNPDTPMQIQLDRMGSQLVLLSSAICGLVFLLGLLRGLGWLEMLKSAISLAVAALPEGLPTVATTTLALGIQDMRRHQVLIRRLDAVEALGAVQVFCLDKTGTLTFNRMSAVAACTRQGRIRIMEGQFFCGEERIDPRSQGDLQQLLEIVALCRENGSDGEPQSSLINGSPTENALLEMALEGEIDVDALYQSYPLLKIQHRTEGRPFMHTLHSCPHSEQRLMAVKGSPTEVLSRCRWQLHDGTVAALQDADRSLIKKENDQMAGEALRVLGVAFAHGADNQTLLEDGLVWVGLVGMMDPLRPGMRELIHNLHSAGIRAVMITGDQTPTAQAIGTELRLNDGQPLEILDSNRLEQVEAEVLAGLAQHTHVFARVSPGHKLRIVQALQYSGHVVAMTGDGINDGPALKAANIGVAMGSSGTDTARSVSDVVLRDDKLATMVVAVRQGRTIYKNIRKSLHFLLATNLSEIEVMLASVALGGAQPLTPIQLLWINLITDIFPGLALALEPAEADVLDEPPRDPKEPILRAQDFRRLGLESGFITAGTLASYGYGVWRYGTGPQSSTLAFLTLTVSQLLHALSCRSERTTLFDVHKRPPNRYLNAALVGSLGVQLLSLVVPGLRNLLGLTSLGLTDAFVIAGGAALPLIASEVTKAGE
jgi:Ca2+-transporting ATPase